MAFQTLSQTTLTTPRVQTLVNAKGDTLMEMNLADAKIVLNDLLEKQIADSVIAVYVVRDSTNTSTISLQKKEIQLLTMKNINSYLIGLNDDKIIQNKDKEIADLNDVVKKQKKEIIKQKILKVIGFTAAVALPITTIILMAK